MEWNPAKLDELASIATMSAKLLQDMDRRETAIENMLLDISDALEELWWAAGRQSRRSIENVLATANAIRKAHAESKTSRRKPP